MSTSAGQAKPPESVWDYPRPPRLEKVPDHLIVELAGEVIAETRRGSRVLETSHPPVYYFPPEDVRLDLAAPADRTTFCEYKGVATYLDFTVRGRRAERAAWRYANPGEPYRTIAGYVAFYPSRVDACWVNGERVQPQAGDFYGGWITSRVVGPFKGGPGTIGW